MVIDKLIKKSSVFESREMEEEPVETKPTELTVWTRDYDSRRVGFRLVGFRLPLTPEAVRYDLGYGYFGYILICNHGRYKGRTLVAEESSGGVVGTSIEDAIGFICRNHKDMPRQIEENSNRLKHISSESIFWEAYFS